MKTKTFTGANRGNGEFPLFLTLCFLCALLLNAGAQTRFTLFLRDSAGTPITTNVLMQSYPIGNTFTVYNTNTIFGGYQRTLTPSSGYVSNVAYPNTYRFMIAGQATAFYAVIPDTTNVIDLGPYITNAAYQNPANYGGLKGQLSDTALEFLVDALRVGGTLTIHTNQSAGVTSLTFSNAALTSAMITGALGYTPATNSNAGAIFALGYTPATNSNAGIIAAQGYTSATNSYDGLRAAGGFVFATNAGPLSLSQITTALTYTPATNTAAGLRSTLGYQPATNPATMLNTNLQFTALGVTNTMYITNGFPQRISTP